MSYKLNTVLGVSMFLLKATMVYGEVLRFDIATPASSSHAPRLGLNLGDSTSWGAAQFTRNVLANPGFEGMIDRALVIVKTANGSGFSDDTAWTGRPDGFWAGATFAVLTGASAGTQGLIFDSSATGNSGLPDFKTKGTAPLLAPGDVVSISLNNDNNLPDHWWFSKDLAPGQLAVINNDRHPDGTGQRTLALKPQSGKVVEVSSYLDAIGDRAGKLLPVNGPWQVRFWLRQNQPGAKLSVRFRRLNGGAAFFQETIKATEQWQLIERRFTANDNGKAGTLELTFRAEGNSGDIILDDVELSPVTQPSASVFRPEVIAALKRLQPGYLRDWQGQLGDTFANRTADVFSRRTTRYRPGTDTTFSYSLPEFLQLSKQVAAQPWLIVPPTFNDAELQKLGEYLSAQATALQFQEILLEFGNENWNQTFRPAGIPDPYAHGQAATRAFAQILKGANNNPVLRPIVNGQYVNPSLSAEFLDPVGNAQGLAVAPYFLFNLTADDKVFDTLFDQDDFYQETLSNTRAQGKELMVYEVNLHTTSGNASPAAREIATASAAAGAALAKRLLTALNLGIQRQCLYTLAQFDNFIDNAGQRETVKLWGIVRDLGGSQRFRPTGLAMAMLNQALPADIYPVTGTTTQTAHNLTLSAFHNAQGWGFAAVSAQQPTQTISLKLPLGAAAQTWRVLRLDSASPSATNEDAEQVRIVDEPLAGLNTEISVTLPAYGFVVVLAGK